ncbi:MAG: TolC family protein [Pseudomonadota bacterium]
MTASAARRGVISRSSTDFYTLGLRLGWEIDIWGRVRATQRTAAFSAYSAEADFLFTQYSIAASVARAYFLVIEAGLQLDVARKSLNALERTNRIVNVQLDNGVATGLDVALSQRDLANARDSVIDAEGAQRLAIRSLEVLLGRYPGALLDSRPELPATPPPPPAGLPSSLLQRRPDLIAAELSVAAAFNNVRAAQAARLPTISLTSTLGGSSTELADVLDPENVAWQVAGNLVGPLFDGGLRQSAVDQGRAQQQQAAAGYAQAALDAFQEVETSLDQNEVLRAREEVLKQAATQANRAFELAQLRYQEGETDLLDVLTIQSTAFAADSALVTVQRALLEEWINLNLALGGDWETAP